MTVHGSASATTVTATTVVEVRYVTAAAPAAQPQAKKAATKSKKAKKSKKSKKPKKRAKSKKQGRSARASTQVRSAAEPLTTDPRRRWKKSRRSDVYRAAHELTGRAAAGMPPAGPVQSNGEAPATQTVRLRDGGPHWRAPSLARASAPKRLGAAQPRRYSPAPMFSKVLVANRGEIAVRVIRALKEMGIASVAVYSEVDREAPARPRWRTSPTCSGPGPAPESYLNVEKLLEVAEQSGAEAIHPGYGFLAENAAFAKACEKAGVVFIGPPPEAIEAMGSKTKARELMKAAGVPIVPGHDRAGRRRSKEAQADRRGDRLSGRRQGGRRRRRQGLPRRDVGGRAREGARGRRPARARSSSPTRPSIWSATSRTRATSRSRCSPTRKGNVVHLGRARLLGPAPPPEADRGDARRRASTRSSASGSARSRPTPRARSATARRARSRACWRSDGDGEPEYFFLEMNTRVQVEHTVTEMATGIDIVREQIRIAAGEPLSFAQEDVELRGSVDRVPDQRRGRAQEVRARARARSPPTASPAGPGVRVDSGVEAGVGDHAPVRPDGREADRLGPRPRGRHRAHAARARRVRDRRPDDADPVPQGAAALRSSGSAARPAATWSRTRSGSSRSRPRRRPRPRRRGRSDDEKVERDYTVEVDSRRFTVKVIGPPPAGGVVGGRRELGRRPAARPGASARRRRRPTARAARSSHRSRARSCKVNVKKGAGGRGRRGRLRDRGDEDGERDHRAPSPARSRS